MAIETVFLATVSVHVRFQKIRVSAICHPIFFQPNFYSMGVFFWNMLEVERIQETRVDAVMRRIILFRFFLILSLVLFHFVSWDIDNVVCM